MKISKRIKKHITPRLIVIGIIGFTSALMITTKYRAKENAINLVKSQTSKVAEGVTLDEAYSKYIQHLGYTYYKDHENNEFVQMTGKIYLKDEHRIADIKITYMVDDDSAKFHSMYLDKMKCNEIDYLILKIKAFDSYDSSSL